MVKGRVRTEPIHDRQNSSGSCNPAHPEGRWLVIERVYGGKSAAGYNRIGGFQLVTMEGIDEGNFGERT